LAYREALTNGAQGLSVAFDLPTHRGYDSDEEDATADVGMAGVAIDSVDDMHRLFEGIALDKVSVSMTMSGSVLPVMAAFLVAAEESGVAFEQLRGTIQNDILKEFMVRNTWVHAPEPSLRITTDVVEWLAEHAPGFNGMSISGYHFQEAGADPALELALTLANARCYLDLLRGRGLDVDDFCSHLSFFFGVGKSFFVEIAKLRAARLLWHEIVSDMGGSTARATAMRMHCQTSGWSLTAQQPLNNIARTTVEAMAAIFGGTQSLHTNGFDEAMALPSAEASRVALDTQHILQHEFGLCEVADPWAGSYLIESLTANVADAARDMISRIDAHGGVLGALEAGWLQRQIHLRALRVQGQVDSGEEIIVGVNQHTASDIEPPEYLKIDGASVRAHQTRRIAALRNRRDEAALRQALAALTESAITGKGNLLDFAIEAMRCRATVGECTRALLKVWPRHVQPLLYEHGRYGAERTKDPAWAEACARVSHLRAQCGRAPRVLLAKLGQDGHDRGARVVASALADAGYEVDMPPLFQSPKTIAQMVQERGFDAVGLSTHVGAHSDLIHTLLVQLGKIHGKGAVPPIFVGGVVPADDAHNLCLAGVRGVYGPGTAMETIVADIASALEDRMMHESARTPCQHELKSSEVKERDGRSAGQPCPQALNTCSPPPSPLAPAQPEGR
jgi:methylmalonyl-CoA mutase